MPPAATDEYNAGMRIFHTPKRRWQFSLSALLLLISVAAFGSAALSGAFGTPVQGLVTWIAVMALVIGAGVIYYGLVMLVLFSPFLLAGACLRWVSRFVRSREAGQHFPPSGPSTQISEQPCESPSPEPRDSSVATS